MCVFNLDLNILSEQLELVMSVASCMVTTDKCFIYETGIFASGPP